MVINANQRSDNKSVARQPVNRSIDQWPVNQSIITTIKIKKRVRKNKAKSTSTKFYVGLPALSKRQSFRSYNYWRQFVG